MLEILISSSALILVLAILRLVLRDKISARLQYALWLLVLARLLVPVSFFHSPVSVAEAAAPTVTRVEAMSGTVLYAWNSPGLTPSASDGVSTRPDELAVSDSGQVLLLRDALLFVWNIGMVVMAVWFLFVNARLARRLRKSRTPCDADAGLPVYVAEGVFTPCLFGLFRPAIYLTEQAASDPDGARQIIAHETTHFRHGDIIWALLRSVCLVVWWFNPLVWLAAALSRQDCELACDEGTIKALGEEARFDYGRTLVGMAAIGARPSDLLCGATTMTTGRRSLKERIARIANAPRMSAAVAVTVLVIAAIAVGCTFSGAAKDDGAGSPVSVPEPAAEAAVQAPQSAEIHIIYPDSSAERSVAVTEAEDVQALFHIYETVRTNAGLITGSYSLTYGVPLYTVHFHFPTTGPGPDYIPASDSFQMWAGGQFLFFDETDPVNGAPLVWYEPDSAAYEELFASLVEKYGAGLPSADVLLGISIAEAPIWSNGEIMRFADGSEIRLRDVDITPDDIAFTVDAVLPTAPAISAVLLNGDIIGAAPGPLTSGGNGGTYCFALWEEPIPLSELAYIACFGGAFGVNGFSVSHATEKWPEAIGGYDPAYWDEVERELGGFADPADVEVYVSETFEEALPKDDIFGGPLTMADYIYGTDGWRFQYTGEPAENDPETAVIADTTIIVHDAAGRALWIREDADALMIAEADGSVTRVTMPDGVDCADMIRHLLPWARGEYVPDAPPSGDDASEPLPPEPPEGWINEYILEGDEREQALAMLMSFASPAGVSVNSVSGGVAPAENAAADFAAFVNSHEWTIRYSPGPAANAPDAAIILTNGEGLRLWIVSDLDYLALVLPEETDENNHPELHFYDGAADGDYLRELWSWADGLAGAG